MRVNTFSIPLLYPIWLGLLIYFYCTHQITLPVFLLFLLKDINIVWKFTKKS